jgi:N-acetylneuraminate synthase
VDDRDAGDSSAYEVVSDLELPYEWIPKLAEYCDRQGVMFLSTPFDETSLEELDEYVPAFKIASFTLSHYPFLQRVAAKGKPMLLSTGAHDLREVREAVEILKDTGIASLALLHCVSAYPTPLEKINARAVKTLQSEFETVVGLSDHTVNPAIAPAAAVTLGASVIEKHVTLDKNMQGPDHSFALEPDELDQMVDVIRRTETALGEGRIELSAIESETADRARRRLFVVNHIDAGERIGEEDVRALRPGYTDREGFEPKHKDMVVGAEATNQIAPGEPLTSKNTTVSSHRHEE